jgi:hypothetical protein
MSNRSLRIVRYASALLVAAGSVRMLASSPYRKGGYAHFWGGVASAAGALFLLLVSWRPEILARPQPRWFAAVLWLLPALMLALFGLLIWGTVRDF